MRSVVLVVGLLALTSASINTEAFRGVDPDAFLSFEDLCSKYGFKVESHAVTTQDGYILKMFHIGAGQSCSTGVPVLFQHGLLDSSDTFIVNAADKSQAFALARAGYDVWLGNSRGNKYSRRHTTYNPDTDQAFWDFSWQEMASFDVPAQVEYVLERSGYERLVYIGHSQGTTQMFAHLSEDVAFADKLYVAIMFNPVASVIHQSSEILGLGSKPGFAELATLFGISEILPASDNNSMAYICTYFDYLCKGGLYLLADEDLNVDHYKRLDVVMNHYPAGTSLKDVIHWAQMVNLKQEALQKYNYGPEANFKAYGQLTPPQYDLTLIRAKVALFAGTADRLADDTDVAWLLTQLPVESVVYAKEFQDFGHASFMWGDDFSYFETLLEVIQQVTS
jgi:pimeloyl-ACP methyl ester carboxylesterase